MILIKALTMAVIVVTPAQDSPPKGLTDFGKLSERDLISSATQVVIAAKACEGLTYPSPTETYADPLIKSIKQTLHKTIHAKQATINWVRREYGTTPYKAQQMCAMHLNIALETFAGDQREFERYYPQKSKTIGFASFATPGEK